MRRFELVEGASAKFWQVEVEGGDLTTQWGRIGTTGQSKTKSFGDAASAALEERKLIEQKTKKGYAEVGSSPSASLPNPSTTAGSGTHGPTPAEAIPDAVPEAIPEAGEGAPTPPHTSSQATQPEAMPPWLVDGDPVLVDDEFRRAALPSRAHPHDAPTPRRALETWVPRYVADTAGTAPHLRARLEATVALADPQTATEEQAIGVLALVDAGRSGPWNALRTFAASFGPVRATELLVESFAFTADLGFVSQNCPTRFLDARRTDGGAISANGWCLREVAARASDEEYAALLAVVRGAWPDLTPLRQAQLALALPDQPELSDELITLHGAQKPSWLRPLETTASTPELAALARRAGEYGPIPLTDPGLINALVVDHGSAAVDRLIANVETEAAADALTRVGTPEAVRGLLAQSLKGKEEHARLRLAIQRWPLAAAAGLAGAATGEGRGADAARAALGSLLAADPQVADRLQGWLGDAAQGVVDSIQRRHVTRIDEASDHELPAVLSSPPWLHTKKVPAIELSPLPVPPVEDWAEGQREAWSKEWGYRVKKVRSFEDAADAICTPLWGRPGPGPGLDAAQATFTAKLAAGDATGAADALLDWSVQAREGAGFFRDGVSGYVVILDSAPFLDAIRPGLAVDLWNAAAGRLTGDEQVEYVVVNRPGVSGDFLV